MGNKAPDVVYLDPMFPDTGKRAAPKMKLQALRQLEAPCSDESTLLESALSSHAAKVVVKRPAKGPLLAGRKPSYSLSSKIVRFDCYVRSS